MYVLCRVCGNDTFRITADLVAECTKCGAKMKLQSPIEPVIPKPDDVKPFRFVKGF